MKKWIGVLFLVLCAGCAPEGKEAAASLVQAESDPAEGIIKQIEVEIDGSKEMVEIDIPFQQDSIPASWTLKFNGEEKISISNEEETIVHYDFKVIDLDQDHTDEILFYRFPGGTAGAILLDIYKPRKSEEWREMFKSDLAKGYGDTSRFDIKYTGNYQVKFFDKLVNRTVTIYLEPLNYKGVEELLEGIGTWIDPVMDYDIKDLNGDGVQEIITTQQVIGISHPDRIAQMKTTYKVIDGVYTPEQYQLYQELAVVPLK